MQDTRFTPDQDDTVDVITPVDFTPPPPAGHQFTWRPRWYHGLFLMAIALAGSAAWFVLTARSVFIDVNPPVAAIEVTDGFAVRVGPRYLMRPGEYRIALSAYGYFDGEETITVSEEQAQTHPFSLAPRPGFVSVDAIDEQGRSVTGARIVLDGVDIGITPLTDAEIPPGSYELQVHQDRYHSRPAPILSPMASCLA